MTINPEPSLPLSVITLPRLLLLQAEVLVLEVRQLLMVQ